MKGERIVELLETDYPIIQAGMAGGVTTPELVAAVSEAGGFGTIGAGYMEAEAMKDSIREVKKHTEKPFGVNLFVPGHPSSSLEEEEKAMRALHPFREELGMEAAVNPDIPYVFGEQIEGILAEKVPVVSFTFGIPPEEVIRSLKQSGIKVMGTATTVEEAVLNEEAGMDAIVAQGAEAGGHRGTFHVSFEKGMIGLMSLIPQITDHVSIPVIAAGGIMDKRGIAAAVALGAEGVQLGTAFVTSKESGAKRVHKGAILEATEADTVVTDVFSGKPARGIENRFIREMDGRTILEYPLQNALTKPIRKEAGRLQKTEFMSLWSGQSPRLSEDSAAADIIRKLSEYWKESL
ncbi:NAD(P)H-dependent flavin oxidoreductase [Salimicrobium salexigens]|uniref:Probable nitronate monooxygenase n=1 Tax=Salimicrobium salexigens TaxID=908941 RepID=A0ABY1KLG3_9BACI|nr:nitronate monooxygenase [Salimicrobium salexigens]SIS47054.1 nitronate monooxygenase [Salimicrobium salexigens]